MGDPRTMSSKGIITHQGHISQVNANHYLLSQSLRNISSRASCDAKQEVKSKNLVYICIWDPEMHLDFSTNCSVSSHLWSPQKNYKSTAKFRSNMALNLYLHWNFLHFRIILKSFSGFSLKASEDYRWKFQRIIFESFKVVGSRFASPLGEIQVAQLFYFLPR